jgi:hypothetical protein
MNGYNPKWDIDLKFGEAGENWILLLGSNKSKIEVKTERDDWVKTGNIAIEFQFKGNPSGIAKTTADWWIHLLALGGEVKAAFVLPVPALRQFVFVNAINRQFKIVTGGDNKDSDLILVPIEMIHHITKTK